MSRHTYKLILKGVVLQLFWFFAVYYGPRINDAVIALVAGMIVGLNYYIFRPKITIKGYLAVTVGFSIYGFIQDFSLMQAKIISFNTSYYPFWINSLYVVFISYYGDIFNYISNLPSYVICLSGGVGGALAYYAGYKLGAIEVHSMSLFLSLVFMSWAIFFCLSFLLYAKVSRFH